MAYLSFFLYLTQILFILREIPSNVSTSTVEQFWLLGFCNLSCSEYGHCEICRTWTYLRKLGFPASSVAISHSFYTWNALLVVCEGLLAGKIPVISLLLLDHRGYNFLVVWPCEAHSSPLLLDHAPYFVASSTWDPKPYSCLFPFSR